MIQINPLKSYIDGGVRAALTTPPSASLVFDLPGKAIWVKGVKLKGTDHTYIFNHDNYITLTNTPDKNNPESEDIKIGVNITTLKNAIDTTYNGGTLALLQEGLNTEERTWLAKILHSYINDVLPVTKNLQINGTNYAIYTTADSLPLFFVPTSLGKTGQILACTSSGLIWIDLIQNTDYRVSLSSATSNSDYRIILKQGANNNPETDFVRFSEYLTFNPYTKTLKINNIKVVTATDIYAGSNAGLVPTATSAQLKYYLRGDGTWVNIATEMAAANTWRPIKVGNTDALGSGTSTGTLSFIAGTGIALSWDATNKRIIITNSSPDINHNTDETVRQVPKTDNVNRPLMMINGGTSAGEQINTSMFSIGIYANASTKMITANGFIKAGSSDDYVLLGGGNHKALSDFAMASNYVKKTGDTMSGALTINTTSFGALIIRRNDNTNGASIQFRGALNVYGYIGLNNSAKDKLFLRWSSDTSKTYTILDTSSTYISSGKGIINGTTITQVDNADKVYGLHVHSGRNNEANKIVRTDASGYILAGWINTTSGDMGTTAINKIYCSNDSYIRYKTPANFFSTLANSGNNISITVAGQNRTLTVAYASNADTVDNKHASWFKQSWTAIIQGNSWSRLYLGTPSTLHHASIFSIEGSIGCVVFSGTFLVIGNYYTNAQIICLANGNYTLPLMRVLVNSSGNVLIDMYWIGNDCKHSSSSQQMSIIVHCIPLKGEINPCTSFTNDSAVPSGYNIAHSYGLEPNTSVFRRLKCTDVIYATHFYENSDIRYKKILNNLLINSNTIANLPLFDFEWIENNTIGTGTSAQAVQEILPNIVNGTDKLTLDYGVLGTIAGITACKELVTLKSELLQLKEKVKLLEDKLRKYENTL